jgi:PKD repeat protein
MTIPTASDYPDAFDSDTNLFAVHDGLRVRLAEDYNPGDTEITVEGDLLILSRFPPTGIITLTEQCSDIDKRAISLFYSNIDTATGVISGLEVLPTFVDVPKLKRITNVTQNVMAQHHNALKDALIAIEEFIGVKGTVDDLPFGPTMEGRVNFLRKVVLIPRAWFTADKRTGIVPLDIEFRDLSFRLGTDGTAGPVTISWDFGDNTTSNISLISVISETSVVPEDAENVLVYDTDGGTIKKTYLRPGIFDVTLTVTNDFGSDSCTFPAFIKARVKAPDEAIIKFQNGEGQTITPGVPVNGPYTVNPRVRAPINTIINLFIPDGENLSTPGISFGGEPLDGSGSPIDPIVNYTWSLGDDLNHPNASSTKASYSIGGLYDLKLRVDTDFGAYRITTYENCIDVVENVNLWLWTFDTGVTVRAYEYGLISETFKLNSNSSQIVLRDDSFLDNVPSASQQKREFKRNTGFAPRGTLESGRGGSVLLYWASGRSGSDPISAEEIRFVEYTGFSDTYITRSEVSRPWNWATFNSAGAAFFVFGAPTTVPSPSTSPTNPTKTILDLTFLTTTDETLTVDNFSNGAQELLSNVASYDDDGNSIYGNFSVYRTAWKDNTGYITRNSGIGPFFRIKSFYRTEGTVGNPFQTIRKLTDMQGPTKTEGQLTNLSQGVYFFNNSGSISAFSDTSFTWSTGGPGFNSVAYRALQDTGVPGYDNTSNTLLCTSDGDKRAYLSFDYSENVFLKFSETDLTFTALGARPSGEQWIMGVY